MADIQQFEDPQTFAIGIVNQTMLVNLALGLIAVFAFSAKLRRPRIEINMGFWKVKVLDYHSKIAPQEWTPVDVA